MQEIEENKTRQLEGQKIVLEEELIELRIVRKQNFLLNVEFAKNGGHDSFESLQLLMKCILV